MRHPILFLFCWLGLLYSASAQKDLPPIYQIDTDSTFFTLDTTHFQLLEDPNANFTLAQVLQSSSFGPGRYFDRNRHSHVYWIRMRLKNALPHVLNLYLCDFNSNFTDMYWLDADKHWQHQRTGELLPKSKLPDRKGNKERSRLFFSLLPGQETIIYQRSENAFWQPPLTYLSPQLQTEQGRIEAVFKNIRIENGWESYFFDGIMIGILFLAVCYNLYIFFYTRNRVYLYFSICLLFFTLDRNRFRIQLVLFDEYPYLFKLLSNFFFIIFFIFFIQSIQKFVQPNPAFSRLNRVISYFLGLTILVNGIQFFTFSFPILPLNEIVILIEFLIRVVYILCTILTIKMIKQGSPDARFSLLATAPLFTFWLGTLVTSVLGMYFDVVLPKNIWNKFDYAESACFAWMIIFFSGALINRYNLIRKEVAQQAIEKEQAEKEREIERNRLIANQNEQLEQQVKERTAQLRTSLDDLKATQAQLIQKEKMASLGELTAGIAHEIQNPLNFVNNFSEVSTELVTELEEEQQKPERDSELETELLGDLKQNLQKITHHGKRASSIVRGMLEHSRTSTDQKQPTDLNALIEEYLRLAYHGQRANHRTFTCELNTDLDPNLPKLDLVAQDMGRVLLNLYNNAFYSVQQKQQITPAGYQPTIWVSTRVMPQSIEIQVKDNGTGIPPGILNKIFQPFFTTKPTGEGTGLGLSLSYDIITKAHGGTLEVESREREGTTFVITLPTHR